jgi:hypothetical protein
MSSLALYKIRLGSICYTTCTRIRLFHFCVTYCTSMSNLFFWSRGNLFIFLFKSMSNLFIYSFVLEYVQFIILIYFSEILDIFLGSLLG